MCNSTDVVENELGLAEFGEGRQNQLVDSPLVILLVWVLGGAQIVV